MIAIGEFKDNGIKCSFVISCGETFFDLIQGFNCNRSLRLFESAVCSPVIAARQSKELLPT
jgi:hypothetical protein